MERRVGVRSALSAQGEAEWERLRDQLELASGAGFWLCFIFSPSARDVLIVRERASRMLEAEGKRLVSLSPGQPDELRQILSVLSLPLDEPIISAGCTWIEALRVDSPGASQTPWQDAWDHLFLRLNERRDALRKRLQGGLVFAAPIEIKPRVREAAPDLWSVRALVLEFEANPEPDAVADPVIAGLEPSSASADLPDLRPDPRFALAQAQRAGAQRHAAAKPDIPQAQALIGAAEGFLGEGNAARARDAAANAVQLLQGKDMLAWTRALSVLGEAEAMLGNTKIAERHISMAISERMKQHAADQVPMEWFDLAGTLALRHGQPTEARKIYTTAIATLGRKPHARTDVGLLKQHAHFQQRIGQTWLAAREVDKAVTVVQEALSLQRQACSAAQESPESLVALLSILKQLAETYQLGGYVSQAIATLQEAVTIERRLLEASPQDVNILYRLSWFLNRLGELSRSSGDSSSALVAFEEALGLRRTILLRVGATPQTLRHVSSSLSKIADACLDMNKTPEADAALREALALHRRLGEMERGPVVLRELVRSLVRLSTLRHRLGNAAAASNLAREAVGVALDLVRASGNLAPDRLVLASALRALAEGCRAEGRKNDARKAEEEADQIEMEVGKSHAAPNVTGPLSLARPFEHLNKAPR